MTMGSPLASSVSGPGVEETDAMRVPSGDHEMRSPSPGSGWLVPLVATSRRASEPSGCETMSPAPSPASSPRSSQATSEPSGDQRPLDDSFPSGVERPVSRSVIQARDRGRPGLSALVTL